MPGSRSSELFKRIPPATFGIVGLCCSVFALQFLLDPDLHHYTMNPRMIVHLNEYYRFITSCLFHGGIMHIVMNMMSTVAISSLLETKFGTIRHGLTILWAMLLTSLVYTVAALLLHWVFRYDHLMFQHSLGFSGVIFHMSILESNLSPQRSRSVFGFISVPSHLYPWALLVALQLFMPNLSFMGHLGGIVTGTLQLYGALDFIMIGDDYIQEMEASTNLRWLTARPGFVACGNNSTVVDTSSLRRDIQNGTRICLRFGAHIIETIRIVLFGRGHGNENIQLAATDGELSSPSIAHDMVGVDDDDDWVGLPPMPLSHEDSGRDSSLV